MRCGSGSERKGCPCWKGKSACGGAEVGVPGCTYNLADTGPDEWVCIGRLYNQDRALKPPDRGDRNQQPHAGSLRSGRGSERENRKRAVDKGSGATHWRTDQRPSRCDCESGC